MEHKLYNDYFDDLINLFPSTNDSLNLPKYKHLNHLQENPFDEIHVLKQKEVYKKYIYKLAKKKNKSIYDKVIIYDCVTTLKELNSNLKYLPINHQVNIITDLMEIGSDNTIFIFSSKKDYKNVLNKLSSLKGICDSIIKLMSQGIDKQIVLPKILTQKLIEQFESFKRNKSYKNTKIKFKLDYDFNKEVEKLVLPALNLMINFLETIYLKKSRNSIGMCDLPNGKNLYKLVASNLLTLNNISIESIHNYGLKEVSRLQKEMNNIKKEFNFKGNLKDFASYLKKQNAFSSRKDVINYYKRILKKINTTIIPEYFNNKVKNMDCEILPVPKFNEEFSPEAYNISGDIQNKRKGKFYINLRNFKENNKMEAEALVLHETNPGHNYQTMFVIESKNIPLFLKMNYSEAYSEGWALYVENMGEYSSLESLFGKYINEMLRAVRLVVDTGIHYYGWSYKKTYNYCSRYLFDFDFQIHNQVLRYISDPGQALCYKMGEKIILDILKKEQSNNNFDIKEFNEKILENGGIPLFLLKEKFNL